MILIPRIIASLIPLVSYIVTLWAFLTAQGLTLKKVQQHLTRFYNRYWRLKKLEMGFGGVLNLDYTVRGYENAGVVSSIENSADPNIHAADAFMQFMYNI